MASVTEKRQPDSAPQLAQQTDGQLVDQQISRTRRAIKLVDFTAGLITLAILVLVFLVTTSLLEHWVIPGGWSDTARTLLFATLLIGIAWYSWRTFWPLLRQPINPAYAALAIEQSSPSLKNSLLNLLLLRNRKQHMSRQIYQAIEQQAAQRLSQVSVESVVDRSAILRLGYVLVAIAALCALYRFLSPKDLLSSSARVLLPWSSIATPSRVQILAVSPGDAKAARGEQLTVTAEVLGLKEDEPVRLFFSTADQQIVGQEISMSSSAGGTEFQCQVPQRVGGGRSAGMTSWNGPESGGGIQVDFSYWIEAGDARSPRYQVAVFARPTLVVNRLRYEYPAYTGYPSRDVQHTGDIRAVEGTQVTLFAQANKPIKTAHVDFEADGRRDLLMHTADQQASVTFPLSLRDDRRTPRYRSYVLRYVTDAGNQNAQPPKYQIDVQPDYSPEIQLLFPEEPILDVAINQEVNFELEARDPDFALSTVLLVGKVGEAEKLQEKLLAHDQTGRFVGKLRKTPAEMGLQAGDLLEYWGVAADNRQPEANLAFSAHRKLRVVGPWQGNQDGEKDQAGDDQKQPGEGGAPQEGEGGQQGQAGGGEQGNASEGEEGAEGAGGSGQETGEPNENSEQQQGQGGDGDSADGDSQGSAGGDSAESSEDRADDSANGEGDGADTEKGDTGLGDTGRGDAGRGDAGQGKVSPEGDDDGSAFERMAKHFKQRDGDEGADPSGPGESGQGEAGDQENQTQSDRTAADGSPDPDQAGDAQAGDAQAGDGQAGDDSSGKGGAAENSKDQAGDQAEGKAGAAQDREADGTGAEGEPAPGDEEKQADEQEQPSDGASKNGKMSPEQGDAGAGDSSGDDQGAPSPTDASRPQEKQGDASDAPQQKNSEAPSQGQDKTESDSEGGQGGDSSGGGQEGTGQQAQEDGKGGAGEHQAADDGAGQASETGEGEAGKKPGDQQKSAGETGESSGDQAGEGSEQGEQSGEKQGGENASGGQQGEPGAEPTESQPAENSDQRPNDQRPHEQEAPPGESAPPDAQGQAGEAGGTGGKPSSPPPAGETAPGDEANLDYARKQTDLILNRLEDQLKKQEIDQSLLEKLGWTQDELRRFVDRWKGLQSQADGRAGPDAAKDEFNDALRSLGLGRNRPTGFNSKITKDKLRDLQDSFRGPVPLEFQEQVRSYIKGTAIKGTAIEGTATKGTGIKGTATTRENR